MDLTGLDVSHPVMESIYQQYYEEPRFRPQPLIRARCWTPAPSAARSAHGFYRYGADGKKEVPAEPAPSSALPPSVWLSHGAARTGRAHRAPSCRLPA